MMTALDTFLALTIPWYAGALIVATLFPSLPLLGRIGIGWGVGFGGVTWLMLGLSLIHIAFTSTAVGVALLVCIVGFAWSTSGFNGTSAMEGVREERTTAPSWLRWPIIAVAGFVLALSTLRNFFWPVGDWDALAAYDLRARAFARYDSVAAAAHHGNLAYAFAQQPFTSFGHTWFYEAAGMNAPAKVLYTACFAALIAAFICFVTQYRSETVAYVVLPGILFSRLFEHAFIAYTNLPSAYGVFVATYATYTTLRTGDRRWCLLTGFLWGFAMWTRQSIEPFAAIGIIALCVPWLRRRKIPWAPLIAAGVAIGLASSWLAYATWLIFWADREGNVVSLARSWVTVFGPAVALSCLVLAFTWAYQRRLHRHLLAALVLVSVPTLFVAYRITGHLLHWALAGTVLEYLRFYLWGVWGPFFLVLAICLLIGGARLTENASYIAIFVGYCAAFVVSTYAFALSYPLLWQGIPDSAVRHSYAMIPVFWACIGITPGTERIVAAFAAMRPAGWRAPAMQGD